jgi:hypothetical protein
MAITNTINHGILFFVAHTENIGMQYIGDATTCFSVKIIKFEHKNSVRYNINIEPT